MPGGPDSVGLPGDLVRADGRSVYRRQGGTRYATRAQLSMEDRMVARAQATTAPRLTRAAAAAALDADLARLERALTGNADDAEPGAEDAGTGSGLCEDQAAAALSVLADGRRVSVVNAPAGAGKTRVLAEIAKAWQQAGLGPVIGITASQSARNTLAAPIDFFEVTEADWNSIMELNARGYFFAMQAAAPHMRESGGGSIVNVASIAERGGGKHPTSPMQAPRAQS